MNIFNEIFDIIVSKVPLPRCQHLANVTESSILRCCVVLDTTENIYVFFHLGFLSRTFTNHWTTVEGGGHLFNYSPPIPPASQTLRPWPNDYCGELTSTHSQQPDSNLEPLVSKRKSLTTKLRATDFYPLSVSCCNLQLSVKKYKLEYRLLCFKS